MNKHIELTCGGIDTERNYRLLFNSEHFLIGFDWVLADQKKERIFKFIEGNNLEETLFGSSTFFSFPHKTEEQFFLENTFISISQQICVSLVSRSQNRASVQFFHFQTKQQYEIAFDSSAATTTISITKRFHSSAKQSPTTIDSQQFLIKQVHCTLNWSIEFLQCGN